MKNNSKINKGFIVPLLLAIITLLIIGGGVYIYENKKTEVPVAVNTTIQQSTITSQNNPAITSNKDTPVANTGFYITPTSVSASGTVFAYNSGFNNEYSELCFDNANQPPNPCSGVSIPTNFSALNPLMSFIIPSTVRTGSHKVQVCGLVGEGSGNETSDCTEEVFLNVDGISQNPVTTTTQTTVSVSFGGNLQPSQLVTISPQTSTLVPLAEGFQLESKNGVATLHALAFNINVGATNPSQTVLSNLYGNVTMNVNGQTYTGTLSTISCTDQQCAPYGGRSVVIFNNLNIFLPADTPVQIAMYATIPPDANNSLNHQLFQLNLNDSNGMVSAVNSNGNLVNITFETSHGTETTLIDGAGIQTN